MPAAFTITTEAQVDWLLNEFPVLTRARRFIGYTYTVMPTDRVLDVLMRLADPNLTVSVGVTYTYRRPRYANHHEPGELPLP